MSQPDPTTPADPAPAEVVDEAPTDAAGEEEPTDDPAPLNRADRRAKAKAATKSTGHAGPPPDLTLRRGRGPRSHTKRI